MNPRVVVALSALALAACAGVQETPPPDEDTQAATPAAPVVAAVPAPVAPRTAPPRPERVVVPEPRVSEVDALMVEFERLRRVAPTELAREHDAARLAYVQSKSDAARVRFAMALTVPGSPPSEEARALELLEPIVRTPSAPLHALAYLLTALIQEQRRIAGQLLGLQQANQTLTQTNQALQQNVHGLQQKLDALRTLERSLTERGEPAPRRR